MIQAEFGLARSRINEQYDRKLEEQTMRCVKYFMMGVAEVCCGWG